MFDLIPTIIIFLLVVTIPIFIDRIVKWISHRNANDFIRGIFESEEKPFTEFPFFPPEDASLLTRRATKAHIVMVAPFGISKKMTVRSRIIPMALALAKKRYEVTLFIPLWEHDQDLLPPVEYDSFQVMGVCGVKWMPPTLDPILLMRLFRQVLKSRPDVIYCFKPIGYSGAISLLTYVFKRVPVLKQYMTYKKVLVDTDDWEGYGGWAERIETTSLSKYIRAVQEPITLRYCDGVTVVSQGLLEKVNKIRDGEVYYLPNGLRTDDWIKYATVQQVPTELSERLQELGNAPLILLYTRFAEFSADRLIDIFVKVLASIPTATLLIIGQSFDSVSRLEKFKLMTLMEKRNISRDRVIRYGWLPYADLPKYWAATRVAIYLFDDTLINRTKSATKVLELMATGHAIVADSFGELGSLIVNRKSGLLVNNHDNNQFAALLIELLQDTSLQEKLGSNARSRVQRNYSWDKLVSTVVSAIDNDHGTPSVEVKVSHARTKHP